MEDYSYFESVRMDYYCDGSESLTFIRHDGGGFFTGGHSHPYTSNSNCRLQKVYTNDSFNKDIRLVITAPFPIEDTGYMEEDFDFCINEGLNLVSYPCENDIAINDALPSEISNNLSSIVGEGVAGVNVNGTWVGSLTQLQAGSGYWFKSSIEACFNYECAEN